MKRTQIYLRDDQHRRVGALAEDLGISRAEVIRRILDGGLVANTGDEAEAIIRSTSGLLADYPGWQEWQRGVRGRSAKQRLQDLSR